MRKARKTCRIEVRDARGVCYHSADLQAAVDLLFGRQESGVKAYVVVTDPMGHTVESHIFDLEAVS